MQVAAINVTCAVCEITVDATRAFVKSSNATDEDIGMF